MSISRYDKEEQVWRDTSGDPYPFALFDARTFFGGSKPWVYAHSMEDAFRSAAQMILEEGIVEVEIGLPSGDAITIDARWVNLNGSPLKGEPR
mgnify:CR=1 FL=1